MDKLELLNMDTLTPQEKEIYRVLRTNIEFTGVENKVLAITSCQPDDGKTTVSYQLACAFADNGKKTLFIDADLRKSVFVQRFGITGNPIGLSHCLSGQATIADTIYKTNKEKLFVMPVGAYPSTPTELLAKDRLKQLLDELKKVFDYVIVDTPPLGNVVDAAVIAKRCDASILVMAADNSSRSLAKSVVAQLRRANPNFLGVVLNKVDMKGNVYYRRKYGKYYNAYYGREE